MSPRFMIRHPSRKIITVLILIIMGVSVKHGETLLFLLLFGQALLAVCRVPLSLLWKRLRLALPFVVFSLLFFSLFESGGMIGTGWASLSLFGLNKALVYSMRLLFTLQALTLLFYGITMPEFFQALIRLRVPGIFVELILFTLRFMEVIRGEAARMLQALRSRGMKRAGFATRASYATLSRLLGGLLLRSLQRSERIYMGMMSRGYRGIPPQLELPPARFADWIVMAVWIVPVAALFFYDKGWW